MSFPENGLNHVPEIKKYGKLDMFSRKTVCVTPLTEISENFWKSFPGFANEG